MDPEFAKTDDAAALRGLQKTGASRHEKRTGLGMAAILLSEKTGEIPECEAAPAQ